MTTKSNHVDAAGLRDLHSAEVDAVAGAVMNMFSVIRVAGITVTTWVDDKNGKVASVACVDGGSCFWSDSYYE